MKLKTIIAIFLLIIFCSIGSYAADLSQYTLNIYNSLVLNGSRCTGMGGAVVSLGNEADDIFYNCAASSVRNKFQTDDFEWDYSLSFANLLSKDDIDYRNAKQVIPNYQTDSLSYISLAVMLLYKRWSVSATFAVSSVDLAINGSTYKMEETFITVNIAHELIKDRLFVSLGIVSPQFVFRDGDDNELVKYDYGEGVSANAQLGIIYAFKDIPLRLGVNARYDRSATVATNATGTVITLPKEIRHPYTLTFGGSWKFNLNGHKTSALFLNENNKGKIKKQKKIYSFSPDYLLIAANITYVSTLDNAVDILSYTGGGIPYRSAEKKMLEPKIGMELSFPTWLKIRSGYYYEGPRITGSTGRHHITFNAEFSLFSLFGADIATAFTMDWSRDFWSAGLSVKIWKY